MATISIIGSGFVGRQVGEGLASLGHEVIFYDLVEKNLPGFTRDMNRAVEKSQVSFICVPTPTVEHNIDLQYLKEAAKNLGAALAVQQGYHVVVVKSTVVPTTTDEIVIPALEKCSGKKAGQFGVCVNPEFLTEIESSWTEDKGYRRDFLAEDRIVIGEYDKRSGDVLEELYEPLKKPIFRVDLKTAEVIKYASNCMLATRISYWNEIFLICSKLGVNSQDVADIVSMDPRIGRYGAVHGKAFGGKCLPKDLKAFISLAKKHHPVRLLQAADDVNEEMKKKYGVRE